MSDRIKDKWDVLKKVFVEVESQKERSENGAEAIFEDIMLLQNDERQQLKDSKYIENPKQDDYKGNISLLINMRLWNPMTENFKSSQRLEKDTSFLKGQ